MGYDMSHAVWHNEGWREMKELRKKLENLKELRDLIKKLGRASGKGPKRRAPQEVRPGSFMIGHNRERHKVPSVRLFASFTDFGLLSYISVLRKLSTRGKNSSRHRHRLQVPT